MPKPGLTLAPEIYAAALDDSPYFRFYERSPVTRLLLDTIPRYLRAGSSVLDVGCGNAIGACHLVAAGARNLTYLGIDADPAVCQWARKVLDSLPPAELRGHIVTQTLEKYLASRMIRGIGPGLPHRLPVRRRTMQPKLPPKCNKRGNFRSVRLLLSIAMGAPSGSLPRCTLRR